MRSVFESMVDLSDNGGLLARFTSLPFPRVFMYGEQNAGLSYLPTLQQAGVDWAEIPFSGRWPMYSNPVAMWQRLAAFLDVCSPISSGVEQRRVPGAAGSLN